MGMRLFGIPLVCHLAVDDQADLKIIAVLTLILLRGN